MFDERVFHRKLTAGVSKVQSQTHSYLTYTPQINPQPTRQQWPMGDFADDKVNLALYSEP